MAAALRKVTQNYDWTLKRADNDIHNVIASRPHTPSPTSHSHLDIKPVDSSGAFPWDANHLRWKFGTEYEELREHLGCSLVILLGWIVSIYYLLRAAAWHFAGHHISSVVHLYEESIKLANLDVSDTFIWDQLVSLFRSAPSLIASLLWEIVGFSVPFDVKPHAEQGVGTRFASRLVEQYVLAPMHTPAKGPDEPSDAQAPADDTASDTSDRTQSQLATPMTDNLKVGIRAMHNVVYDEARRSFQSL